MHRGPPAGREDAALLAQCERSATRGSGPGGQRRNKVQTAAVLVHRPTGLRVRATERRSAAANLAAAVRRLRIELAGSLRERVCRLLGDEELAAMIRRTERLLSAKTHPLPPTDRPAMPWPMW